MPEAFAVLAVFVVAVASFVGAKMITANPSSQSAEEERLRLQHYHAWLVARLELAQREGWGPEMMAPIARELELTESQRAKPGLPMH